MALHFRRSKKFGPFRLTFTEKGIGYSYGNRLFRYGKSATGKTYISGGYHGLNYRKQLSSGKNNENLESSQNNNPSASPQDLPIGCWPAVAGTFCLIISPMFGLVCWDSSVFKWLAIVGAGLIAVSCLIFFVILIIDNIKGTASTSSENQDYSAPIKIEYTEETKPIFNHIPKEVFFDLKYEKCENKSYYWVPSSIWEKATEDYKNGDGFISSNELR